MQKFPKSKTYFVQTESRTTLLSSWYKPQNAAYSIDDETLLRLHLKINVILKKPHLWSPHSKENEQIVQSMEKVINKSLSTQVCLIILLK